MKAYNFIALGTHPEWRIQAAHWFHEKWEIPLEEYPVPQWYVVTEEEKIIAGAGVIENDFHDRKDLTPNVCALYVEPEKRNQGIAGKLLEHICREMVEKGINTLYLITEHTAFYERYGWDFLCMVQGDDGELMRM